jgi:hypothetical protein
MFKPARYFFITPHRTIERIRFYRKGASLFTKLRLLFYVSGPQLLLPPIWAQSWEDRCRLSIPSLLENSENILFEPARRFWHGQRPEWNMVAKFLDKKTLFTGGG